MKKFFAGLAVALLCMAPMSALAQVTAAVPFKATGLTNTAVTIKATIGTIQWGTCYNPSKATAYVQFFDKSAAVTVGTDVPVLSVAIATLQNMPIVGPSQFVNAIKIAATTTAGGNTAPSAALDCNFGFN